MLSVNTSRDTSSVIEASSSVRASGSTSPAVTSESTRILMLTSWSEQSTPAELSIASVLTRPPHRSNSIRPSDVTPRLPPSPMTLARNRFALTRTVSLARSPTSASDSDSALM